MAAPVAPRPVYDGVRGRDETVRGEGPACMSGIGRGGGHIRGTDRPIYALRKGSPGHKLLQATYVCKSRDDPNSDEFSPGMVAGVEARGHDT